MTDPRSWHHPAGSLATSGSLVALTSAGAGWSFCGLQVVALAAGDTLVLSGEGVERAVLPLGGSATIDVDGRRFELDGRDDVFSRVTDWAYLPLDSEARLSTATGCELALPSAVAERRFAPAHIAAGDVVVEVRGACSVTRQVTNFMTPDRFDGADKLMCCELLTPDGNWSSYPPHRHDGVGDCLVNNEEIYYFRIGRIGSAGYASEGFAMHRTYTVADVHGEDAEVDLAVHDGDVFLIPEGYHGPCVAAPGYPLYYLNVLAGPSDERSMAFCDDPTHHWVRDAWTDQPVDSRCPMTSATGRVS
jgi:5-deoxy-glucuronate isomerase